MLAGIFFLKDLIKSIADSGKMALRVLTKELYCFILELSFTALAANEVVILLESFKFNSLFGRPLV